MISLGRASHSRLKETSLRIVGIRRLSMEQELDSEWVIAALVGMNRDLTRFGLFLFWKLESQNSVAQPCVNFALVNRFGKRELS